MGLDFIRINSIGSLGAQLRLIPNWTPINSYSDLPRFEIAWRQIVSGLGSYIFSPQDKLDQSTVQLLDKISESRIDPENIDAIRALTTLQNSSLLSLPNYKRRTLFSPRLNFNQEIVICKKDQARRARPERQILGLSVKRDEAALVLCLPQIRTVGIVDLYRLNTKLDRLIQATFPLNMIPNPHQIFAYILAHEGRVSLALMEIPGLLIESGIQKEKIEFHLVKTDEESFLAKVDPTISEVEIL